MCDDASGDNTYELGLEYPARTDLPLTVIRQPRNLGYGGNQKAAYRWAIEHELDIVVLLHGDGQYAPEVIEDLLTPFDTMGCDAVFGSRVMAAGSARLGGMPLHKYVGNRILTAFSNAVIGMSLSEWHSGLRAYRVDVLCQVPFESNSNGFDFDTQIIIQLHEAGHVITEIPIPTHYGDEVCYVSGMRYARDVARDVVRYRLHKMGFGSGETAFTGGGHGRSSTESPAVRQLRWQLGNRRPSRIVDLGATDGRINDALRKSGHSVVGLDPPVLDIVGARWDGSPKFDATKPLAQELGGPADVVIAPDLLSQRVDPISLFAGVKGMLAPDGVVMVSITNVAHWYPRLRLLAGRFDYDRRGVFDAEQLRFFTRRSFDRMARRAGLHVRSSWPVGIPVEVLDRGSAAPTWAKCLMAWLDRLGMALWPNLFAYQFLVELEPAERCLAAQAGEAATELGYRDGLIDDGDRRGRLPESAGQLGWL